MSLRGRIEKRIYHYLLTRPVSPSFRDQTRSLLLETLQKQFLIDQAPMRDVPSFLPISPVGTKYAYIHPKTLRKLGGYPSLPWVCTEFMPEGCVIYSPNAMPGVERL
jgi:hypothetical protein